MKPAAGEMQTVVILGAGHWAAEEMLAALTEFLAPYRNGKAAVYETHERSAST